MSPLVSVIIPTYNRSNLLAAALRSVLAQTYPDYEIIVVDDASDEDIAAIVRSVAGPAGRCIRIPHGGPAAARNAGVEAAGAELIAFLDSDDLWHRQHLARTVPLLHLRPEVGLVYHDAIAIDETGRHLPTVRRTCAAGRVTSDLFVYDFIFTPSVVCRRDLVCQAGGFDGTMVPSEDYDLWLKMSLVCEFAYVEEPLMYRRWHGGNISLARGRNDVLRAVLKERFWQQCGGRAAIDPAVAHAALAKAFYHAARAVWREGGDRASTRRILRKALHYHLLCPRALLLWAATFRPGGSPSGPDLLAEIEATTHWIIGQAKRS